MYIVGNGPRNHREYVFMKKIMIVKEKHGTMYFDVSTDELLHKTSMYFLKKRLKEGWYGEESEPPKNPNINPSKIINSKIIHPIPEPMIKAPNISKRLYSPL